MLLVHTDEGHQVKRVECTFNGYGFGHWALGESECRNKIQNPFRTFSDFALVSVCKNTGGICAQGDTSLLATSMHVPHLTGEHEITEKRELVDDNDRHIEA